MTEPRHQDSSTKAKSVFSTIQPDAPSPIPQASKGPTHKQRAIKIAIILVVLSIISIIGYYVLVLNEQSV